jgi:hypothetical protein
MGGERQGRVTHTSEMHYNAAVISFCPIIHMASKPSLWCPGLEHSEFQK